jgi:hypothetical protein
MTRRIGKTTNDFQHSFGNSGQGACTLFSLLWAKESLRKGRGLKRNEIPKNRLEIERLHSLNRWDEDNLPVVLEKVGLASAENHGNDYAIATLDDLARHVHSLTPHVAIFWNSHHTMGYRYAHNEKEFFDPECGLYRARHTRDILAKIMQVFNASGYAAVEKCHVVKLA